MIVTRKTKEKESTQDSSSETLMRIFWMFSCVFIPSFFHLDIPFDYLDDHYSPRYNHGRSEQTKDIPGGENIRQKHKQGTKTYKPWNKHFHNNTSFGFIKGHVSYANEKQKKESMETSYPLQITIRNMFFELTNLPEVIMKELRACMLRISFWVKNSSIASDK